MTRWIALLRGINVGGRHTLKMADLRADLTSLGFHDVQTYIQSGNVVFSSRSKSAASLAKKISDHVEQKHGFRPHVLVITAAELAAAIEANPFQDATGEPKSLHFFFLTEVATDPNMMALNETAKDNESFHLTDSVFYLHAPDGIGTSKLAGSVERYLGVSATGRNYRTVDKLAAMLAE